MLALGFISSSVRSVIPIKERYMLKIEVKHVPNIQKVDVIVNGCVWVTTGFGEQSPMNEASLKSLRALGLKL